MNDRQRSIYLDAIGIDSYVSRFQLPGAAVSLRPAPRTRERAAPVVDEPSPAGLVAPAHPPDRTPARPRTGEMPGAHSLPARAAPQRTAAAAVEALPRFSVPPSVAGPWRWGEDLQGMPLTREQVQVVQAMASALKRVCKGPVSGDTTQAQKADIAQFDWPMHNNQQLDLGAEAASAALASFLTRRLAQDGLGLVLLGKAAAARVTARELGCDHISLPHSSADLLARPELKKQAWTLLKTMPGLA